MDTMEQTTQAPSVGEGKAMQLAAEKAYDEIAEREGLDENGDEIVDMSGDDEAVAEVDTDEEVTTDAEESSEVEMSADAEEEHATAHEEGGEPPEPEAEAATSGPAGDEALIPPHTWPEDWKQAFDGLPPAQQQMMLAQNKSMNKVFSERMMALGKQKKEIGDIQRAVNPHLNRLQRAGITPNVAIQRSLAWDAHIQKNPAQGIRDMAKAYGVDLGAVQQETADENRYLTPTERALQAENQALTGKVEQIEKGMAQWNQRQQQSAWSRRQANAQAMLDEFMNATDSSGNRLHPYIEHCAPMMSKLIDAGLAENLEDAYQKAAALTPEVAQAREKTRKAREAQAARDQVKKARKASSGIVSGGRTKGGKPTKKGKTFEQRASENYDRIANA